jgi:hypothetical protein
MFSPLDVRITPNGATAKNEPDPLDEAILNRSTWDKPAGAAHARSGTAGFDIAAAKYCR